MSTCQRNLPLISVNPAVLNNENQDKECTVVVLKRAKCGVPSTINIAEQSSPEPSLMASLPSLPSLFI